MTPFNKICVPIGVLVAIYSDRFKENLHCHESTTRIEILNRVGRRLWPTQPAVVIASATSLATLASTLVLECCTYELPCCGSRLIVSSSAHWISLRL